MEYITKQVGLFTLMDGSALDIDDLNGPGLCLFPHPTGDLSVDYGLFILSTYSESKHFGDRLRFAKNLHRLLVYLGGQQTQQIVALLHKYVRNRQVGS